MVTATSTGPAVGDGRQIVRNSAWNAAQQVASVMGGSIFALVLAFYLPIEEYGVYSYALALCSVGTAISSGGLHGLGIRYIVNDPARTGHLLVAMIIIREVSALAALAVLIAVSMTIGDTLTVLVSALMLTSVVSRALDAPELWYLAQLRSSVTARIRITVTAASTVARAVCLVALPDLWLFAALYVVEAFAATGLILSFYRRDATAQRLALPRRATLSEMSRRSAPLALSAIANQINLKGDILLIQALAGSAAVGIYSVAARVGELAYFLPVVIMNSTLPLLLHEKNRAQERGDRTAYDALLQRSYDRAFLAGAAVATVVTAAALSPMKNALPTPLDRSAELLAIYIWASPLVFLGAVYSKWIISENYLWASFARHVVGGASNLLLNAVWIPEYHLKGAAMATVVSYAVANFLMCFVGRRSRPQGVMMMRAVVVPVQPRRLLESLAFIPQVKRRIAQ